MFIVWGETDSHKKRGVVADRCPVCGKVGLLRVTQIYRRSHLYFIPLSSGRLIATVLSCAACKGKTAAEPSAYARFLPEKQAGGLPLEDVMEQTNPGLAQAIDDRERLEQEAREGRSASGAPDPRVTLAFARVAEMGAAGPKVYELQARLSQWAVLDPASQARLLQDVDTLADEHRRAQSLIYLIRQMVQKFKPDVDGCLGILAFLAAAGSGIGLAAYVLSQLNASEGTIFVAVVVLFVAAFVPAVLAHRAFRRHVHRKFFRTVLLPAAEDQGVPVADVVAWLGRVNTADRQIDANLLGLAKAVPLLKEVLAEQGTYLDEPAD